MSIWLDITNIFLAAMEGDSWMLSQAMRGNGVWLLGALMTVLGGFFAVFIYAKFPLIERHLERSIMVYSYLLIAIIIFVEVIRRFVFSVQAPWSTTFPPVLFLVMAWFGCAYNIRLRTHLAFAEFRVLMPRFMQMLCFTLDMILWLVFCIIVVVTASRVTVNSAANFQILAGTDNFMQWWYLITVPVAFILMAGRVLENWLEDLHNYRTGKPLIKPAIIGEERS